MLSKLIRMILEYLGILKVIIDIGNEEIRIIEAIKFLVYFRIISIKSEKVYDVDQFSFIIERFLEKNTTHKIRRINLTLSSTSIIPLFFSFPGIPKSKIESAVLWEIERNIPLPLEEAYFSYKTISEVVEDGKKVWNIMAVIAKKDEIDKYLSTFRGLNIIVEDISYLPINILSAIKLGGSENAVGYVYICDHSIELIIILKNKIINFAHYIGDFQNINQITLRNIVEYYASFIKKRIAFLERIIVISKHEMVSADISESLFDSLNILTLPATHDDFLSIFDKSAYDKSIYDLIGFANQSYLNLQITNQNIRNMHIKDVALRVAFMAFLILDFFSIALFPAILISQQSFNLIKIAKESTIPINEIPDPQVREMAEKLKEVQELKMLKDKHVELVRKINDIKTTGIVSSSLKVILNELCRKIPGEVWLKKLSMQNNGGEITGYSLTSEGLENFIFALVNSHVVQKVVLKSADLIKTKSSTLIKFVVTFGANP
ncbi:MAG: pilus assembly protein PilM [Brevinematales bacterium]|nr:pilus assembly protein PilM [Brevinematales bacterium]